MPLTWNHMIKPDTKSVHKCRPLFKLRETAYHNVLKKHEQPYLKQYHICIKDHFLACTFWNHTRTVGAAEIWPLQSRERKKSNLWENSPKKFLRRIIGWLSRQCLPCLKTEGKIGDLDVNWTRVCVGGKQTPIRVAGSIQCNLKLSYILRRRQIFT